LSEHSPGLAETRPEAENEISPQDTESLRYSDRDLVELASRQGEIIVKVEVTDKSPQGVAFITFHLKEVPAKRLTVDALAPVAKIPEFQLCSVKIRAIKRGLAHFLTHPFPIEYDTLR
jgi:predicted molibdopterin-dependent oxidoreductase YjgC